MSDGIEAAFYIIQPQWEYFEPLIRDYIDVSENNIREFIIEYFL